MVGVCPDASEKINAGMRVMGTTEKAYRARRLENFEKPHSKGSRQRVELVLPGIEAGSFCNPDGTAVKD